MNARMYAGAVAFAMLTNAAGSDAVNAHVARTVLRSSESWYLHGIVRSSSGRAFAFSIAFRRIAVARTRAVALGRSRWRVPEIVASGVTLADLAHRTVWHAERVERAAFGFAGATRSVPDVRVDNWSLRQSRPSFGANPEIRIRAAAPEFALQLANRATGQIRRGVFAGLRSRGTIVLNGTAYGVSGTAGFEHRFVSAESDGRRSETFALQLVDGREALLRIVPNQRGQTIEASGMLIERGGTVVRLGRYDVGVGEWAGTHWRSPHTGISYPSLWIVGIPSANLSLTVSPVLGDQEIVPVADGRPYWAGAVDVTDNARRTGRTNAGTGWVMLDGFGAAG